MIVKGSMNYDQFGRKRKKKVVKKTTKARKSTNQVGKTFKSSQKILFTYFFENLLLS